MSDDVAVPAGRGTPQGAPLPSQVRQWGSLRHLSSPTCWQDALAARPFERMAWLAVAMLGGIFLWCWLPSEREWFVAIGLCGIVASVSMLCLDVDRFALLRHAIVGVALMTAAGMALIWVRSEAVGTPAIGKPIVGTYGFRILAREETGRAERPVRLMIATTIAPGQTIRARVTVPQEFVDPALVTGAVGSGRMRLVAPSRPVVPGAYDPARAAWFEGIAATGSLLAKPSMSEGIVLDGRRAAADPGLRDRIGDWVATRIADMGGDKAAAAIAETLVTGNRAGLPQEDAQAMRDAGLAHLLSISGLHVGAVIAVVWFVAMRGLALIPWLALRLPLPIVASALSAGGGIAYTLLTGAELPTIRACLAAVLVLLALTLGRRALSMRLIAIAAISVLMFWPEAAISASFQMSFAAVVAIVALHNAAPVEAWHESARHSGPLGRLVSWVGLLFVTGVVIELTLLPLVLFHFHRAGIYGSLVNLVAIPLTTLAIMPALGLAIVCDALGLGAPFWWAAGRSIAFMLDVAHFAASRPGSVVQAAAIAPIAMLMFCIGGFWLALWSGRARLWGLVPIVGGLIACWLFGGTRIMIAESGRQILTVSQSGAFSSREMSGFGDRAMLELAGLSQTEVKTIAAAPGTQCTTARCRLALVSADDRLTVLVVRKASALDSPVFADECAQVDVVIASLPLPETCRPSWKRLDAQELSRQGGAVIDVERRTVSHARPDGDRHGW